MSYVVTALKVVSEITQEQGCIKCLSEFHKKDPYWNWKARKLNHRLTSSPEVVPPESIQKDRVFLTKYIKSKKPKKWRRSYFSVCSIKSQHFAMCEIDKIKIPIIHLKHKIIKPA